MSRKLTTQDFVKKAMSAHGDKFDYSTVDYIDSRTKVTIICKIHGPFEQLPTNHIRSNCPGCSVGVRSNTRKFISNAALVHGDEYDYSMVEYLRNKSKVKIICKTHGLFEQNPNNHLNGAGCPLCVKKGEYKRKNTATFVSESIAIHGDKYDYSETEYVNSLKEVRIICKIHGVFEQAPKGHLKGYGCQLCANHMITVRQTKTTDQFIEDAIKVHGDKYDYSLVDYVRKSKKVEIICKVHGVFKQTPNNHLSRMGCQDCAVSGFDYKSPGFLYYLKLEHEGKAPLFKIGITNFEDVSIRVKSLNVYDGYSVTVVAVFTFKIGQEAYDLEQRLHKEHDAYRYYGDSVMQNGNTELFIKDVMELSHGQTN